MKQIVISEVFSSAWELTKRYWAIGLACVVGVSVIQYIVNSMCGPNPLDSMAFTQQMQNNPENIDFSSLMGFYGSIARGSFVSSIISILLTAGVTKLLIDIARGTRSEFTLDAWKLGFNTYINYLVTCIIVNVITFIGYMFCILPGIYLQARLQFAAYCVIDRNAGIGEALSASWQRTSANGINLSLLIVCFFFVTFAGFLCCCVGAFLSMIIINFATIVCYFTLFTDDETPAELPSEAEA